MPACAHLPQRVYYYLFMYLFMDRSHSGIIVVLVNKLEVSRVVPFCKNGAGPRSAIGRAPDS